MIVDPLDQQICVLVAQVLMRHYPGHDWLVEADRRKGLIDIRNVSLDGSLGCRIPMGGYATASELEKLAMRYGGEILERFHVERGRLNSEQVNALPTDFAGRLRVDR
jgi:hypothetical protein